jgi:hypothetical protein
MKTFKTEIVKTKEHSKTLAIIVVVLFIIANLYIFLIAKENQNVYLKSISFVIYALGLFFLFRQSFIKPATIGFFEIADTSINLRLDESQDTLLFNELDNIVLKYTGYGSWWTHSIYGNKNYLEIACKNGEDYKLEILLRNRSVKNDFKAFLNTEALHEKFQLKKMKNTTCEF